MYAIRHILIFNCTFPLGGNPINTLVMFGEYLHICGIIIVVTFLSVCRFMGCLPLLTLLWSLSWVALPLSSHLKNWRLLDSLKFSQFQLWGLSTHGLADRWNVDEHICKSELEYNLHIVNYLCLQLQLKSLFSTVLNSTRKTPSQLDSSTFVALGHIVCGIDAPIMRNLNPVEFRLNYLKKKKIIWII